MPTKKMRVSRGTARALRRLDMVRFKRDRRERLQQASGTIKVNAPSLDMLNKYIGRPA